MTDEQLAAIRARLDAATPGPWYAGMSGNFWYVLDNDLTCDIEGQICSLNRRFTDETNAEFIAAAGADIAALLKEVDILRGLLADAALDGRPAYEAGVKAGADALRKDALAVLSKCRLGMSGGMIAGIMDWLKQEIAGLPAHAATPVTSTPNGGRDAP